MIKKIKKKLYKWLKSTYTGDKFLYQRNLKTSYDFSNSLILIYTMGKVGSTSIYESLKNLSFIFNIFHLHKLNDAYLKDRERLIKNEVYKTNQYPKHIHTDLLWKPLWVKKLLTKIKKPIHIITVVREPISRNISLFFQWIDFEETDHTYSFKSRNNNYPFNIITPKDDLSGLYDVFLNRFTSHSHEDWLKDELKNVFQIDLLAEPFDKEKGFSIFKSENTRLLTLKLESLDFTFEAAMKAFLDEKVKLIKVNEASAKNIKGVYKRFKKEIRFPKSYINTLYSSDYVKHFYTPIEIEAFQLKWNIQFDD